MDLTIKQRFSVVFIYAIIILFIGYYFSDDWSFLTDSDNKLNSVLIATGLALILGSYITEPYFSKPVDVISRWVAIFLFLIDLKDKSILSLYPMWFWCSIAFTFIALLLIFIHKASANEKYQKTAVDIVCKISRPEVVFSILYFDIVVTSFKKDSAAYPVLIGFGFLLLINKPIVWVVKWITRLITYVSTKQDAGKYIGRVIGHDSTDFYSVEIEPTNSFRQRQLKGSLVYLENQKSGIIAIVFDEKILVGKKWLQVVSLRDSEKNLVSFDLKSFAPLANEKTIFSKTNAVYLLDVNLLTEEQRELVNNIQLTKHFNNLIGYVWKGSTISQIRFQKLFDDEFLRSKGVGEGTIISTTIAGEEVLYQIIDGRTDEEALEYKDTHGYTVGTAQKLGKYSLETHELNTVRWLPDIYAPIFLLEAGAGNYVPSTFIGKLPNTQFGIAIKVPAELVTHNTAILGILGIGKSCLTFELLQKLIAATEVKIFCIDLTSQYVNELPRYVGQNLVQDDFSTAVRAEIRNAIKTGNADNSNTWGNLNEYAQILDREIDAFLGSNNRVLVLNPDWHNVEKANSEFRITHNDPLTVAQKTRIISERIFIKAKAGGETKDARFLIVFEEAHSLVPEWNSVANDGDKNATNGTAKVILQGRKYGLGSLVVTQRTANISKSVLNQCNTIFALRVFDDTGKQFLENYIGSDYANLLPTLEERSCIAIGKALKLKQPIIIRLNDMDAITLPPAVIQPDIENNN